MDVIDKNLNGAKDSDETLLSGIKVRLYDVSTNDYLKKSTMISVILN